MSADAIYVKERPHFGSRQIRTLKGLHVGQKVIQFSKIFGNWALLEIKELIIQDGSGFYIIGIDIDSDGYYGCEKRVYLEQHSIMPRNEKEKWSNWCLLRTKRKTTKGFFK